MEAATVFIFVGVLAALYLICRKMAKAGSPLFKIGYCLYVRTRIGHVYYKRDVAKARQKYNNEGHSIGQPTAFNGLKITPIAISLDNYSYLVTDETSNISVLIDPSDPDPIQAVLDRENITPTIILTTHKHWDHSGGNSEFRKRYRKLRVYGGSNDNVPGATNKVNDMEEISVGRLKFKAYHTPGHTVGHVVYLLDGTPFQAPSQLFAGDHLFLGGIGRMFEGNAKTMLQSLDRMCEFPDDTLIWPGHEYAQDNLEFAQTIDPDNLDVKSKREWVLDMRKGRQTTSPSTLAEEKLYNPFLRSNSTALQDNLGVNRDSHPDTDSLRAETLAKCREAKDKFKYKL